MLLSDVETHRLFEVINEQHTLERASQRFAATFPQEHRGRVCKAISVLLQVGGVAAD